ncbi:MAG: class I SAM-dependent methyltransferase [Vicinamibacterales bacterium]
MRTFSIWTLFFVLVCGSQASIAQTQTQEPGRRLFPPQDLGLLDAPDRDAWQRPDQIMDALGIADGAIVADLGAGGGWFTLRLARRVGPNGIVYAEDVQPQMIEAIGDRVRREGLTNVRTVLGTTEDPRLPQPVDAALIVDAYHEMEDPVTMLRNVASALRPGGRLGIVGFIAGAGGPGPPPEDRPAPGSVIAAAEQAGLALQSHEAVLPFQFLLVFVARPEAPVTP